MSVFVVVSSQQCPACRAIKMKDKMGTSFLDKIREWVSPYTTQFIEVEMEHNGDLETLTNKHPGFAFIIKGLRLPGFFIFSVDDWKNKSGKLPNTVFTGVRREKEVKEWAKAQSDKKTENFFTHPPQEEKKQEVKEMDQTVSKTLATAGSVSVKIISLYE